MFTAATVETVPLVFGFVLGLGVAAFLSSLKARDGAYHFGALMNISFAVFCSLSTDRDLDWVIYSVTTVCGLYVGKVVMGSLTRKGC